MTAPQDADVATGQSNTNKSEPLVPVTFTQALIVWARIGLLSFGGPAGQIALMHREVVEKRKWLDEDTYLNALSFCMLLPGPEAMQLATYAGWRLHGLLGGLAAGLLFVLPGAIVIAVLAYIYAAFGNVPLVEAILLGIKAAVLVIVIEALIKISKRALRGWLHALIAGSAFVAIFFFAVPFPLIILAAALIGWISARGTPVPALSTPREKISVTATGQTILLWLVIWFAPLLALAALLGTDHVLTEIGFFFSKVAVIGFGGAYAVLAYVAQSAVETHGWLKPGEMLEGLGLAETTPGPLVLVNEFVGYLAAARHGGGHDVLAGIAGAAVTLWALFAPCFLWIFAGAPYVTRIGDTPALKAALQGITAAVVGVILNLSIWFALHVLAPGIKETWIGPIRLWTLAESGFDFVAVALSTIAAVTLLLLKQDMFRTLGLCTGLALAWHFFG